MEKTRITVYVSSFDLRIFAGTFVLAVRGSLTGRVLNEWVKYWIFLWDFCYSFAEVCCGSVFPKRVTFATCMIFFVVNYYIFQSSGLYPALFRTF